MLHINYSSKKYTKIFLELRYKEIFSLPENKFKILDKLSSKFSEFDANQPDRITMLDPQKRINVNIFINRLTIDWDEAPSITDFTKYCNSLIKTLRSVITIEEPKRIGIRSFLCFKSENNKEIDDYILNKYISPNARNITNFADELSNPRVNLSGRKGSLLFNLGIGITQEQIIEGDLSRPLYGVINNYLTFDIDNYKESGININNLESYFKSVNEYVDTQIIEYIKRVEG